MFRRLFGRGALRPLWQYSADASIWRFVLAPSGEIVGEVRDTVLRTASFFCLDGRGGAVLWSGVTLPEPWWIGIEHVGNGVVLLHEYEKPDLPRHKRLHALDLLTGSLLWGEHDGAFWFASGASVFTVEQGFERRRIMELDLRTGRLCREFDGDAPEPEVARRQTDDRHAPPELLLPEPWDPDEPSELGGAFRRHVGERALAGETAVLRLAESAVVSWFEKTRSGDAGPTVYTSRLFVWDERRQAKIYDDILCDDAGVAAGDSCLVTRGNLLYVRKYRTLVAVPLQTEGRRHP